LDACAHVNDHAATLAVQRPAWSRTRDSGGREPVALTDRGFVGCDK
jgi:hypothetical protein